MDLAITDSPDRILSVENVGNLSNSDHTGLVFDILSSRSKDTHNCDMIFDWPRANVNEIKNKLKNFDFKHESNVNEDWNDFSGYIQECINEFVPKKQRRSRNRPVWMNRKVMQLSRKKQRRFKDYCQSHTPETYAAYKSAEKECKKAVKSSKKRFEKKLSKNPNDKPFYSYLKSKTKCRSSIGPLKVNNVVITKDIEIANSLNEYFASVFTNAG